MKHLELKASIVLLLLVINSCTEKIEHKTSEIPIIRQLKLLNEQLTKAAEKKSFNSIDSIYADDAMLMAEYNPLIEGKSNIKTFYTELYQRQDIASYNKVSKEVLEFDSIFFEHGDFTKTFKNGEKHEGKFVNIWKKGTDNRLKLSTEAFGYYHPIDSPAQLRVYALVDTTKGLSSRKAIPLELAAYHALNENCVRDRDTKKLLETYTTDAIYYPFATTKKSGMPELTKHFYDYHRPPVKIDTIEVWTYDYDKVNDGIIQYSKFYVEWTVPNFSGTTKGTGIIYYKRQKDNSLKIHRQIGFHIHE